MSDPRPAPRRNDILGLTMTELFLLLVVVAVLAVAAKLSSDESSALRKAVGTDTATAAMHLLQSPSAKFSMISCALLFCAA